MQPAKAHWLNRDTIGLLGAEPGDTNGLPESVVDKNPFLRGASALKIPEADLAHVPALLKGQLVLAKFNGIQPADATALQISAVLDDLFYFGGELGARQCGNGIRFRLWAPTAQAVRLLIYDDPNGPVQAIHSMTEGLRVVMDVVYNHTVAAGQDTFSVLDKVVPGYYYRLDQNGDLYTNAFGPGTASEHRMFSKLMLDTLKMWAEEYQVDGFRFDLMSFSFKDNMLEIKKALHEIDPTIFLYGEGWDFGEVVNNAFGENASPFQRR